MHTDLERFNIQDPAKINVIKIFQDWKYSCLTLRDFYTDYFDKNNSLSSDVPAHFCDVRVTLTLAGRFSIDVVSTTAKY